MLTQPRFLLLSGSSSLDCLTVEDFDVVRDIIEARLLNALCLTVAPSDVLWDQLLADTLAISVQVQQGNGVKSESVRNYSYTLADYANSWELLGRKSGDLLNKFNACETGITFQSDIASRIYGYPVYDEVYDERF